MFICAEWAAICDHVSTSVCKTAALANSGQAELFLFYVWLRTSQATYTGMLLFAQQGLIQPRVV
jgi:hypothetical protein